MLKRQSFTSPGVWQAARSRSATANRSAISCRLVLCSLSHPFLSHTCKLIYVPNQENLRTCDYTRKEVPAFGDSARELLDTIDCRVHLTPKFTLRPTEGRNDL